jgi:hypothetical protein
VIRSLKQLDRILRGDATRMSSLATGRIEVSAGELAMVVALLGMIYGACMGAFAVIRTGGSTAEGWMQLLASAVKLPLLFGLTLVVTFPSLYVFNALVGSRLSSASVLHLLIATQGVILAVLASLGPIVVFFSMSTTSYPFMVLLNVACCAVSGVLGLSFLLRTMHRLVAVQEARDSLAAEGAGPETTSAAQAGEPGEEEELVDDEPPAWERKETALDRNAAYESRRTLRVVRIWMILFATVGAQMGWVLRPFIGHPDGPFEWFRSRESNFFEAVLRHFAALFGG